MNPSEPKVRKKFVPPKRVRAYEASQAVDKSGRHLRYHSARDATAVYGNPGSPHSFTCGLRSNRAEQVWEMERMLVIYPRAISQLAINVAPLPPEDPGVKSMMTRMCNLVGRMVQNIVTWHHQFPFPALDNFVADQNTLGRYLMHPPAAVYCRPSSKAGNQVCLTPIPMEALMSGADVRQLLSTLTLDAERDKQAQRCGWPSFAQIGDNGRVLCCEAADAPRVKHAFWSTYCNFMFHVMAEAKPYIGKDDWQSFESSCDVTPALKQMVAAAMLSGNARAYSITMAAISGRRYSVELVRKELLSNGRPLKINVKPGQVIDAMGQMRMHGHNDDSGKAALDATSWINTQKLITKYVLQSGSDWIIPPRVARFGGLPVVEQLHPFVTNIPPELKEQCESTSAILLTVVNATAQDDDTFSHAGEVLGREAASHLDPLMMIPEED